MEFRGSQFAFLATCRARGLPGQRSYWRQDSSGFFESAITWPAGVNPLTIDVFAQIDRSGFRKIARFDRVTIGCTPPQVNAITPLIGGRFASAVFRADITGEPTFYAWNFGGDATPNTSTEAAPFVTFGETGFFQGSLTLISDCSGSTVHSFEYEIQALRFDAFEYAGTITEEYAVLGISCSGPARAEFSYVTISNFPEFRVTYEFDCPNRPKGTAVLFTFNQADLDEAGFVTRDGMGLGEVAADHLMFQWGSVSGTTTFEGDVVPP